MQSTGLIAQPSWRRAIRSPGFRLLGRLFPVLVTGVIASLALSACEASSGGASGYPEGTIAAVLAADDRFDTLMQITEQDMPRVALDSFTASELDITLFAPTDDAFAALPAGALDWLRNDDNVNDLQLLYDHHVVGQVVLSMGDLRSKIHGGGGEVEALDESPVQLTLVEDVLHVDGAAVIDGDIEAVNGVIHVIDAVMIPDSVSIP
jgi:transforming growth factor-beta-induced protein